jgi:hypothetical protein
MAPKGKKGPVVVEDDATIAARRKEQQIVARVNTII